MLVYFNMYVPFFYNRYRATKCTESCWTVASMIPLDINSIADAKSCVNVQIGALQRNHFQTFEFTMEVGGWVQVLLGIILLENHLKIALNQY